MVLKNKTILIVAQEDWGDMFISKHHYAYELSKLDNKVFFINGPDQKKKLLPGEVKISGTEYNNIFLVEHRFFYPYFIKFKLPALHLFLVRIHINRIIKKIKRNVDVVWSFDLSNTMPLVAFPKKLRKIFMPVDEPLQAVAIKSAIGADVIFSVTDEILKKYQQFDVPKHFINHGVSKVFINESIDSKINNPIRVGISGNILRPDIDHQVLLNIVEENQNIVFDFWGTVDPSNSNLVNIQNTDAKALTFVGQLKKFKNVVLHGQLKPQVLAQKLKEVDAFLICYDLKKDQSKGTNYHKILEFLAVGKVLISNNVTTYNKFPELIEMAKNRNNNDELLQLFSKVINNLEKYNCVELQKKRIDFAKNYIYEKQIFKIQTVLEDYSKN